ncbi:hypothetical protein Q9L42_020345 (plasmid) [Methylomarinum sp. Ch1-1]|uniref:Antitoxin n=1 Tax=Methylomarinum roseum TaxID=3067653 RepID=A0AAU7P048_9GAMM|nr:hypothetical protein [Methylomarinum sp. Ch1-1]MDP4523262.1 hypothetical protein [Methylomarinum sp. Ch1-1]
MRLTRRQLQTALNRLAKANSEAQRQRALIYDHCVEVYGAGPGDLDNDAFIDAVDGGCGEAHGMTVDEFERSMKDCSER